MTSHSPEDLFRAEKERSRSERGSTHATLLAEAKAAFDKLMAEGAAARKSGRPRKNPLPLLRAVVPAPTKGKTPPAKAAGKSAGRKPPKKAARPAKKSAAKKAARKSTARKPARTHAARKGAPKRKPGTRGKKR